MTSEKKPWSQPQLIVLGRGAPEECLLQGCKNQTTGNASNGNHSFCQGRKEGTCAACQDTHGS
jgi:hypothetical protein